jgi:hypothetical protein
MLMTANSRRVRGALKWPACNPISQLGVNDLRLETAGRRAIVAFDPHGGCDVVHDRPDPNETRQSGQVLNFRLRRRVERQPLRGPVPMTAPDDAEPLEDLSRYEDEDRNINYRHRLLMNVIAVVIVSLLVGAGVWIADVIADMQKVQDCTLQGRQNCAPIEVPVKK